jgi:hypothetical protein
MKREALAILSTGALLRHREFGNRCLYDIHGCEFGDDVPLLGGHRMDELLGHVTDVWVENFVVKGALRFTTPEGRRAFEQLPTGVSMGLYYDPDNVVVVDGDGRERDFDLQEWRTFHQDPAAILHVKTWEVVEVSLTDQPMDRGAIARPFNREARRVRRLMEARQRSALDRDDDDDGSLMLRAIMPRSGTVLHGAPEPLQVLQAEDRRLVFYDD